VDSHAPDERIHPVHAASDDFKARHIMLGIPLSCTACRYFVMSKGKNATMYTSTALHVKLHCSHSLHEYNVIVPMPSAGEQFVNKFSEYMRGTTCPEFLITKELLVRIQAMNSKG